MADALVIRLMSNAGRSRLEMNKQQSFDDLKTEISKRLGIDKKTLNICKDQAYKKKLTGKDTDTLGKLGLKNGDMLYIANQDSAI